MPNQHLFEAHVTSQQSCLCTACMGDKLTEFLQLGRVPVDVGSLSRTAEEASHAALGSMHLMFCHSCGLIFNRSYEIEKIKFEPGYDASLVYSQHFNALNESTARRLFDRFDLEGKSVLEIGCGQAHLLKALCKNGSIDATGVDPTSIACETTIGLSKLRMISRRFDHTYNESLADIILLISVVEDIPDCLSFFRDLRAMIGDRKIPLYIELFDGFQAIKENQVWSPHYEQCNYFGEESFVRLLRNSNFRVIDSGHLKQNDQYLYFEAEPTESHLENESLQIEASSIEEFAVEMADQIELWNNRLLQWKENKKRVFLWGSGGKAISFLSMIPNADLILGVVDINPIRQGLFTPITAKEVISVEELAKQQPDIVIISNPNYRQEIEHELQERSLACQLFVA